MSPPKAGMGGDERARGGERRDEIERRAYERFVARGEEHGRDQNDWFEAERDLSKEGRRTSGE